MRRPRPVYVYWLLFFMQLGLIFLLSSWEKPPGLPRLLDRIGDKVVHLGLYAGVGFFLFLALFRSFHWHSKKMLILLTVMAGICYGLSDEFHQYFVPSRSVSVWDLVADISGTMLGVALCIIFVKNKGRFFHADHKRI